MNERTWKSLQVSYQHWMKSSKFSIEIKETIKSLYYQENRLSKTPEEIYQEIINVKIGICEICNHDTFVGLACPNILPYGNKLPENPNEEQLKHYNSWHENFINGCKERDNSYLIERNKTEEMRESSRKVGLKTGTINITKAHKSNTGIKFCKKCNMNTSHLLGVGCLSCHNSSDIMRKSVSKRNVENWKNPEYARKISRNLGNYLGIGVTKNFCKNCKKETFHIRSRCLNCNPNTKFSYSNFIVKDNDLYFYDKSVSDYILWEDFKNKFLVNVVKTPDKFIFFPTFRTQDSGDWSGAKSAFEQNLTDNCITWFVYIKFYIDNKKNVKPLVVGKSGSKLVNFNGSDINFSNDIEDGPARRFLKEKRLDWCKTQIAILSCDSEQNALDMEKDIGLKYNLFYS